MSLTTPTTKQINDNIISQLEATLNQSIPLLPKSFLRVLAKTMAGLFVILYKYIGFMFLQIFVVSASAEETTVNGVVFVPLIRWGRLIGVGDPAPATNAELLIDITVDNQVGTLPAQTQLINSDNGVTYLTLASILLNAPVVQVTIQAASDQSGGNGSGAIGNLDPGAIVTFANPLANVARDAVVVSQVVTGAEGEDIEVYRERIIDRFQNRPQGGALADYVIWGEEPAGILNVYPYTSDCPGQVDVFVEATVESSGNPDGIPTEAQLQEVLDSIELDENGLATRRPANALVNTFPIDRVAFDVVVSGLIVDNEAEVQQDIETAVEEYFLEREPFIAGLTVGLRLDRITDTGVGGVVDDIVTASGGIFANVVVFLGAAQVDLYTLQQGQKAKASSVTFV